MKPFTAADVQAAHDELRPHIQKLVDRFGQAQAYEIASSVARRVCPDPQEEPKYIDVGTSNAKAVN
jgi:hypothetical protein